MASAIFGVFKVLTKDGCLALVPPSIRMAVEFRHASWLDEEVYALLRARNTALCVADTEESTTPVVVTADFGYLRLRDRAYGPEELARWAATSARAEWRDAFVYFKHEESGPDRRWRASWWLCWMRLECDDHRPCSQAARSGQRVAQRPRHLRRLSSAKPPSGRLGSSGTTRPERGLSLSRSTAATIRSTTSPA